MKLKWSDLWRWDGTIDRLPYLFWGVVLFGVKYMLDTLVATQVFGRTWTPLNYLMPRQGIPLNSLKEGDMTFYGSLLAMALPFMWAGVVLTLKRLHGAKMPTWLVCFFFMPALNFLFFLILSLVPSQQTAAAEPAGQEERPGRPTLMHRAVPDHPWGSAAMGLLLTIPIGLGLTLFGTEFLKDYGWGLFVALPFAMGLASVLIFCLHRPHHYWNCIGVACLSVGLLGLILIAVATEGLICVAMAAPIALALAFIGGSVGYIIQHHHWRRKSVPAVLLSLLMVLPFLMGAERAGSIKPPLYAVHTAIVVNASPAAVWHHVVSFSMLPPPQEWLFRRGIAYPIRAEIQGRGAGAVRHCVFSTGAFVEPITQWDEPHLLKFSVTSNPPPMEEWTPYHKVHPPHLDGFLVSRGGQFLLTPLPGGRTRLEGTTWYHHHLWPAAYWKAYSDYIIHQIHLRVLRHIKTLSES